MKWLLILLFTLPVFGSIPDNSFEPEQAKYDSLKRIEMRKAADRAMERTNAEYADEIAEIMKRDSVSLLIVKSLKKIVARKAYQQRRPYMYWLLPHSFTPEVSFRSPSQGKVTDYMLRLDIGYPNMELRIEQEQENALGFTNYYVKYLNDNQQWQYEFTTRRSQAQTINRQKVGIGYMWWFLRSGIAATTEGYDTKYTQGL
ncbi:hypothetical protein LCGC14_2771510, partial [marine sediment metagenome]